MMTSAPTAPLAEAVIVRKLNQIFYDVEAEQYEQRHPEVMEGQADWWVERGETLVRQARSASPAGAGLKILDLGCGTGLVSNLLSPYLAGGDMIVGVDHSAGMLKKAVLKRDGARTEFCKFVRGDAASLHFASQTFHMLTLNSFLHHVYDYGAVLREADRVLRPGGYLVLANEPNREFFQSLFVRLAASAWKLVGFGMKVPEDLCERINSRLRQSNLPSGLRSDEILRLVEFHSPIEQGSIRIDKSKGFSLAELLAGELSGYTLVEQRQYSTFYHRPRLEQNAWLQRAAKSAANVLNGRGNLFSAVLRKCAG